MIIMYPAWSHTVEEVLEHHEVEDVCRGLDSAEAEKRLETYGPNELKKAPSASMLELVLEQFDDTLVKILLLAAAVSFGLAFFEGDELGIGAFVEPGVILLILILNAVVGVWQEANAENALEALKEMSAETAKVIRDGQLVPSLPAKDLVPGDLVEIAAGDRVPADCRILKLHTAILRAEQATLTGESMAVQKSVAGLTSVHSELQAKESMLFAGTGVASGSALAIVNSTGMNTEIGKIQEQIEHAAAEDDDTPLKKKLDEFGEALAKIILLVCILVWLININHFMSFEYVGSTWLPDTSTISFSFAKATFYFKVAVALAVAAIPEGLPAVITTCLALGTRKMAKRNAIVRQLPSVETLGCTTIICSDKTGTLTTNQMSAVTLVTYGSKTSQLREVEVDGTSFNPDDGQLLGVSSKLDAALKSVATICALCNDSTVMMKGETFKAIGQPTEAALLILAEKIGVEDPGLQQKIRQNRAEDTTGACSEYVSGYKKLATLEFDRDRKSMSVLCARAPGRSEKKRSLRRKKSDEDASSALNTLYVKGAAECILERCSSVMLSDGSVVPMDANMRKQIKKYVDFELYDMFCIVMSMISGLNSFSVFFQID